MKNLFFSIFIIFFTLNLSSKREFLSTKNGSKKSITSENYSKNIYQLSEKILLEEQKKETLKSQKRELKDKSNSKNRPDSKNNPSTPQTHFIEEDKMRSSSFMEKQAILNKAMNPSAKKKQTTWFNN